MKGSALGNTTNKKKLHPDGQIALFKEKECNQFTETGVRFPLYNFALQPVRQTVKHSTLFLSN